MRMLSLIWFDFAVQFKYSDAHMSDKNLRASLLKGICAGNLFKRHPHRLGQWRSEAVVSGL